MSLRHMMHLLVMPGPRSSTSWYHVRLGTIVVASRLPIGQRVSPITLRIVHFICLGSHLVSPLIVLPMGQLVVVV